MCTDLLITSYLFSQCIYSDYLKGMGEAVTTLKLLNCGSRSLLLLDLCRIGGFLSQTKCCPHQFFHLTLTECNASAEWVKQLC